MKKMKTSFKKQFLIETIQKLTEEILCENKSVSIKRGRWENLDYENGERVLEKTPQSIVICSDDCMIRLSAYKRYDHPNTVNPLNGWAQNYWKFLGWEVNAITYRNEKWEIFDKSFPRRYKSKNDVLAFIKRTKAFELAKKELGLA